METANAKKVGFSYFISLGAKLDEAAVAELLAEAGGNPFLLTELLGCVDISTGRVDRVPTERAGKMPAVQARVGAMVVKRLDSRVTTSG